VDEAAASIGVDAAGTSLGGGAGVLAEVVVSGGACLLRPEVVGALAVLDLLLVAGQAAEWQWELRITGAVWQYVVHRTR
jgi:hypothetical protein